MTCIAGMAFDGKVWIGADSAGIGWNLSLQLRGDAKVFRNGPYLFGFTSSFRMGDLLRYCDSFPVHPPGMKDHQFLASQFINGIRGCFKQGGFAEINNAHESGGNFLLGYRGKLYEVCGDFQVGIPLDDMAACGCGFQLALGAMAVLRDAPATRIRKALHAAERFSAGVRGPFKIMSI